MKGKKQHNKNNANAQDKNQSHQAHPLGLNKHIHFNTIDSTNTWAKTHSDQWDTQGITLVTASEQTTGRGRFKRRWESPAHVNIYATFCFWLNGQDIAIGHMPQLLALAATHILEKYGFEPTLKWPNDVLLKGKKVAGILCETILEKQRRGIICGIGLNVNMPKEKLELIDRPATSLLIESGQIFDLAPLLNNLQDVFISYLYEFILKGFKDFFPLLERRLALKKGQMIHFRDNQTLLQAQFERLQPNGAVQLRLLDGTIKVFYAGEFVE